MPVSNLTNSGGYKGALHWQPGFGLGITTGLKQLMLCLAYKGLPRLVVCSVHSKLHSMNSTLRRCKAIQQVFLYLG